MREQRLPMAARSTRSDQARDAVLLRAGGARQELLRGAPEEEHGSKMNDSVKSTIETGGWRWLSTRAKNALWRELGVRAWEGQFAADKLAQVPYDDVCRWPDVGRTTLWELKQFLTSHGHSASDWN